MGFRFTFASILCGILVASCGGGGGVAGGGGAQVLVNPQGVAINEFTAKPVAADALENVLNASGTRPGVAVQAIVAATQVAANSIVGSQIPTGTAINRSVVCPLGGSVTVTGNVANSSSISAGDMLTFTNHSCRITLAGVVVTLNGQIAINIVSGSITAALPFHVVLDSTLTNLSAQAGSTLVILNGDAQVDWNVTSATSQTLLATGISLTTQVTISGVTHHYALRNYTQALAISGTVFTDTLSGTIETDSSSLGPTRVTYTISTPAAVIWDSATGVVAAGAVKVIGASHAQLTLIFTSNGNAELLLDINGDGTVDQTLTTNLTELAGFL